MEVGLCRQPPARLGVGRGPLRDTGVGAVGDKGGVGVDVGYEGVEGADVVGEDSAGGEVLSGGVVAGGGAGEGEEGTAARGEGRGGRGGCGAEVVGCCSRDTARAYICDSNSHCARSFVSQYAGLEGRDSVALLDPYVTGKPGEGVLKFEEDIVESRCHFSDGKKRKK